MPGRKVVGFMPFYVPRELIHAAGALPLGILGGGDQLEVIHGDAYYQSYICRIPRSTIELGVTGRLDFVDGMLFPSICDVIRNLSGMWKIMFPKVQEPLFRRAAELPRRRRRRVLHQRAQRAAPDAGRVERPRGRATTRSAPRSPSTTRTAHLVREVYAFRARQPWKAPSAEVYLLMRAGMILAVEEHSRLLRGLSRRGGERGAAAARQFARRRHRRLLRAAAAQPHQVDRACRLLHRRRRLHAGQPLGDARTCRSRATRMPEPGPGLSAQFRRHRRPSTSPTRRRRALYLVEAVKRTRAEGVIFAAPSFCDPALLERPMLQHVLAAHDIPYIAFKYAENSGQMQPIREQAGTFADSIKLWSDAMSAAPVDRGRQRARRCSSRRR